MSLGDHNSLGREVVCLLPSLPVGGMLGGGVVGGANGMVASIIAVSFNCMATECRYVSSPTHNTYVCTYVHTYAYTHTKNAHNTRTHTYDLGSHRCPHVYHTAESGSTKAIEPVLHGCSSHFPFHTMWGCPLGPKEYQHLGVCPTVPNTALVACWSRLQLLAACPLPAVQPQLLRTSPNRCCSLIWTGGT